MRRLILASLAVILVGVSGLALAATERQKRGDFVPLAASGIGGNVKLNQLPAQTETHIVLQARGLQQNVEYKAVAYLNNNCQPEAGAVELARFFPKGNGMINWTGRTSKTVDEIGSISLVLVSDETVQACAPVVIQQ